MGAASEGEHVHFISQVQSNIRAFSPQPVDQPFSHLLDGLGKLQRVVLNPAPQLLQGTGDSWWVVCQPGLSLVQPDDLKRAKNHQGNFKANKNC